MQFCWPYASKPSELGAEAHVWAVPLKAEGEHLRSLESLLSADELQRAAAFKVEALRPRFIAAHGALRILIARYIDERPEKIEFGSEHRGKPCLARAQSQARLKFNLSHSGDLALIAVMNDCEIGVDVEHVRDVKDLEALTERYFHPVEVADVMSATNRSLTFFRHWTAKEAVLKAFGSGITERLDHFQVPLAETASGLVDVSAMPSFAKASQCWVTRLSPCDNFEAAIALLGPERRVRGFVFDV